MEVLVLGSGTSHGVPMIGCNCPVCTSADPRNYRNRPSVAVYGPDGVILVDTPPELRLQSIATGLTRVDAVLFTHTHADHIFGLDDLRRFNDLAGKEIPIYGDRQTLEDIRRIFRYIFVGTQMGGGKPRLALHEIEGALELCGLRITPFYVMHGALPVLAFRFDEPHTGRSAAYVTDVNSISPESMEKLHGLDLLILDAVRYDPHSTHFGLYQALEVIQAVKPRLARLTHISHRMDHETVCGETPAHVAPAFDGERIEL